ncbi:segregation and condensation protein B [Clostridia bacterium]|nr:segregation and condensation protein B [Clostridia bacterium]GHV34335.1 segregation and condensation protein B [Clostridia bacterium]
MEIEEIESLLEGILFASGEPVTVRRLVEVLEQDEKVVTEAARRLQDRYKFERRGIRVVRLEGSFQMVSAPECALYVRKILEERKPPPMARATLETLAIVAYKQPVTRVEVELIRGVDSSNTVNTLAEKGLIEECGRREVPGRPMLFRTTPLFLRTFGLSSLSELPLLDTPEGEIEGQLTISQITDNR